MAEIRGADLIVEYLIREKVKYIFGYAGHGVIGMRDDYRVKVRPAQAFTGGLLVRGIISLGM